jgi:hypothetical protein
MREFNKRCKFDRGVGDQAQCVKSEKKVKPDICQKKGGIKDKKIQTVIINKHPWRRSSTTDGLEQKY